jgi:hypothetical protein
LSTKEERIAALVRTPQDKVLRAVQAAMHTEVGDAPELLTHDSSPKLAWAPKTRDLKAAKREARRQRGTGGHRGRNVDCDAPVQVCVSTTAIPVISLLSHVSTYRMSVVDHHIMCGAVASTVDF